MQQMQRRAMRLCSLWRAFEQSDTDTAAALRGMVLSLCELLTGSSADKQGDALKASPKYGELCALLAEHGGKLDVNPSNTTSVLFWINALCLHFTATG